MDTPLVSIIIPAYNHEPFIEGAVRSALAQDYPNLELLVLDDGSTDNTYARLQQLRPACEKRFARVVFATQPNAGTAVTMSRLVAQCRGKYISACASDDEYLPACVSTQVAVLEAHPEAVQTLPDNYFIAPDGTRLERAWNKNDTYEPLGTDPKNYLTFAAFWQAQMPGHDFHAADFHSYENLLKKHNFLNGGVWRSQTIKDFFPLPQCKLSEDYYISLQMAKRGRVIFVDQPLFNYRMHPGQTVCNRALLQENEQNLFTQELQQVCRPGQEHWKEILQKVWFTFTSRRKGLGWLHLERRNCYACSQRLLVLCGHSFILHTRYKYSIPTEYKNWLK